MTTAQRSVGRPGRRWISAFLAATLPLGIGAVVSTVAAPSAGAVDGETWTDDFASTTLHPEWEVVNPDPAAWSLSDGVLRITGQTGDTYQEVNSAKNVFMVDIPAGDFAAEVAVRAPVAATFQGAGLIAWQDMDNYVRSGLTYVGTLTPSGIAIENDVETAGAFRAERFVDRPESSAETLQLQRVGDVITTRYRDAAGAWVDVASVTAAFPTTQVGIYALGALDGTTLDAAFDDFRVTAAAGRDIQPSGAFAVKEADTGAHLVETADGLALTPEPPLSALVFTAAAQPDGSLHLRTTEGERPVVTVDGRVALGQTGDAPSALRLTDAGGGELYLRDAAGTGYAGGTDVLALGDKADAVRFKLTQVSTSSATLAIDGDASAAQISDTMFGIFYEDINYAADGGLYAELVRNRSFEFNSSDNTAFTGMTAWQVVNGGGAAPEPLVVDDDTRLNEMNRNHFRLVADGPGDGLRNLGYNNGFAIKADAEYEFSLWARTATAQQLTVRLENASGTVAHAEARVAVDGSDTWKKYEATLTAAATTDAARLVVTAGEASVVGLDMISLMPQDRWVGPVNGRSVLRKDLAEKIAEMKPTFLRFPGGCVTNVGTFRTYAESGFQDRRRTYQWKETIGPVEERPTNWNFWGYNQSYGIGYLEYFKFAEDLGAEPLPVVSVGANGCGGAGIPEMHDPEMIARWVDDTVDLIEFANGDTTTEWGAKRAALGHPEPFGLEMIGLGNEENTTTFEANFPAFRDAIKARYPDIQIISNSGPDDSGARFDALWDYNRRQNVEMVDEHYYNDPDWFLLNNHRYDSYDRNGPKVFLGEYASRGNTFYNALVEASYMTGLQRNADVVRLASYAPLLSNESYVQWNPDAIWFDNDESWSTPNWEVQKMFGNNVGDEVVPSKFTGSVNQGVKGGIFLSTWNTAAAYDNVRVTANGTGETLFSDDFATADQWNPVAGSWAVADGEYVQSSATTTDARSTIDGAYTKDWTDYTLELDARKISGSEGFLIGFGAKGGNDYYWWNIGGWNNTRSVLQKARGGSAVEVKAVEGRSVATGATTKVKIVVSGNDIALYLDGELHMTYESAADERLFQVVTRDKATGDVVAKVVNTAAETVRTEVTVSDVAVEPTGEVTQLTAASLGDTNTKANPTRVVPVTRQIDGLSNSFGYDFPAHSVTFLRMRTADGVAPVVDDVTLRGTSVGGWYADPVTVAATASDDRRLDRVEFRVDGGDWVAKAPADAEIRVVGDGEHTVEVRAVDAAGNTGVVRPVTFGIDAVAPVSNATVDPIARTVAVRAADAGVGVERVETRIGTTADWQPYTEPVAVGDTETTVQFRAVDRLGNVEAPGSLVVPAKQAQLTSTTTTVTPVKPKAARGDAVPLTVRVQGADGVPPTGEVRVLAGEVPLASATLADGAAALALDTSSLRVGKHTIVVRYLGDGGHRPSQTSLVLHVTKPKKR